MMMETLYGVATHIGNIRKRNEDSMLVSLDQPVKIIAVADGMGGHQGGDVASALAVEVLKHSEISPDDVGRELREVVCKANEQILERAQEKDSLWGMGTTLTLAGIHGNQALITHVGDSRAYLLRNGSLQRLTYDHSFVENLLREGKITEQEAKQHPQRHVVLQALGVEKIVEIDQKTVELHRSDLIMLCTDGVTDYLSDEELEEILQDQQDLQALAERLVEEANARGGHDNSTVVLYRFNQG